jgi:hypothetical protein
MVDARRRGSPGFAAVVVLLDPQDRRRRSTAGNSGDPTTDWGSLVESCLDAGQPSAADAQKWRARVDSNH